MRSGKNYLGFIIAVIFTVLPSSCTFLPEREEPLEPEIPESFGEKGGDPSPNKLWWEDFNSPDLDRLVEESFAGSFDLAQAEARLRQARASAVIAGGDLYPEVNLEASAGATRARTGSSQDGITNTTERYSLGLAAGYEIDLWGRVRSTANEAETLVLASGADLDTARITLAAEVTDRWVNIVELKSQLELVKDQLESNRTYLELLLLRQRKGLTTALAVFQQEQIVAATESLIPLLESQLETTRYELAVLLGRSPRSVLGITTVQLPEIPPVPEIGLPSLLLENRPDIRAAYFRLESSDWGVAAARADRLPALTLTASTGYDSTEFKYLFDDWFAGFAGALLGPLIDGGRRAAEADRTLAVSEEKLAFYRETVLNAIKEVEGALIREKKQTVYMNLLKNQLSAAKKALSEAFLRYRKGDIEYLDVLASLTSVQSLERDVLSAGRDLILYRVSLYRALGSRWNNDIDDNGV